MHIFAATGACQLSMHPRQLRPKLEPHIELWRCSFGQLELVLMSLLLLAIGACKIGTHTGCRLNAHVIAVVIVIKADERLLQATKA